MPAGLLYEHLGFAGQTSCNTLQHRCAQRFFACNRKHLQRCRKAPKASCLLGASSATATPFAATSVTFKQQATAAVEAFRKLPLHVSIPLVLLGLWLVKVAHSWLKNTLFGRTVVRMFGPKLYLPRIDTQEIKAADERRAKALQKQGFQSFQTGTPPLPMEDPRPASEKMSPEEEALATERLFSPTGMARQDIQELNAEVRAASSAAQPTEEELEAAFRRAGEERARQENAPATPEAENIFLQQSETLQAEKQASIAPGSPRRP